jgi:hypothetical protein
MLPRESVKFTAFGVIWTFGVLGQPKKGRFFLAERAGREALGIIDGERINND